MGDIDRRAVADEAVEAGVDIVLGNRVQRRGGLIEHHDRRGLVERPGQGDLLRLPAGGLHPTLVHLVERRFQPHGPVIRLKARFLQAFRHPLPVGRHARGDILLQRRGKEFEVLEYDRKKVHVLVVVVFADVDAVQEDLALLRVVKAAQELDHRRFAAAVAPDHGQPLADVELEAHVAQRPLLHAGVAEAHMPEFQLQLVVVALLHRQRALVLDVGRGEEVHILLHILAVEPELRRLVHELREAVDELADGADDLEGRADRQRPGQGL